MLDILFGGQAQSAGSSVSPFGSGGEILSLFMLILNDTDTDTCDFNDLQIFAVDAG